MRDTFHGNIKYSNLSSNELFSYVESVPELKNDVEYTFASAYIAWICSKYDIPVPEWCKNSRSFMYSNYMLTIYNTEEDICKAIEHPLTPFAERGWYVNEFDLQIV